MVLIYFPQKIALRYPNSDPAADPNKLQQVLDDLKKLQQGLGDDSKKPQQDVCSKPLLLCSTPFFNEYPVAPTNKVLSDLKPTYDCQRDHTNAAFSKTLQDVDTLEPIFKGMSDKINKIQAIWFLVSARFAQLASLLDSLAFRS